MATTAQGTLRDGSAPQAAPPPAALRVLAYFLLLWRRTWRGTLLSEVLSPLLYLGALGFGLGTLVDSGGQAVAGVDYVDFIAGGVLASTAMLVAVSETTWPVLGAVKWQRTFHAMLATPVGTPDVAAGQLAYVGLRVLAACTSFLAVAALLGAVPSWWGVLGLPFALLTGLAFAAPVFAYSATLERETAFTLIFRFGVMPMFLFSGTFFPLEQLPDALEPVAWVTPLWHGVELCRAATLGELDALPVALHVGYLLLWLAAGWFAVLRTLTRRMVV